MSADFDFLIRRREIVSIGLDDGVVRRSLRSGSLSRVVTGAYVDTLLWRGLEPIEQHRARVLATAERLRTPVVFSHFAAAAIWGIRILGRWPQLVDVTLERASGGRSDGALKRHCTGLEATDIVELNGLAVTSPAQTMVDLARVMPFVDAVVAMDSALHRRRLPAPLVTIDEIYQAVDTIRGRRGFAKANVAGSFATSLSDSPEESHSRVQIHLLGFPAPQLQQSFTLPSGKKAESDFYWDRFDHIGECDGRAKYLDAALRGGRSPEQVVIDEKNRENELRRVVRQFSRWEPADLYPPRKLYDGLTRDGLPSSKRRP